MLHLLFTTALVQVTTHQLATTHQTQREVAPIYFYQGFPGSCQFFDEGCTEVRNTKANPLCFFESHSFQQLYMMNKELYLNLSKYVEQLRVVKRLTVKLKKFR